mgnify:FL=1
MNNIEKIFNDELKRNLNIISETINEVECISSNDVKKMVEEYALCYNVKLVEWCDNRQYHYDLVQGILSMNKWSLRVGIHTKRALILYQDNS